MEVKLVGHTSFYLYEDSANEDISALARIARVCTMRDYAPSATASMDDDRVTRLIKQLYCLGHLSVFEHFNMTFFVDGVSRACSLQLARHRHISRTEKSQRYIAFPTKDEIVYSSEFASRYFVYPPAISANEVIELTTAYCDALHSYNDLIERGARKEDARFVLPEAAKTTMYITLNLRTLIELWQKRGDNPAAQWEIRELVKLMVSEFCFTFGQQYQNFLFKATKEEQ